MVKGAVDACGIGQNREEDPALGCRVSLPVACEALTRAADAPLSETTPGPAGKAPPEPGHASACARRGRRPSLPCFPKPASLAGCAQRLYGSDGQPYLCQPMTRQRAKSAASFAAECLLLPWFVRKHARTATR